MGEKTQPRREVFFTHGCKRQIELVSQVWTGRKEKMLHLTELLRSLPSVYVRSTNHVVQTYSLLRMTLLNCSSEEQILLLNQESTSIQGLREFISGYRWVEQLSAWRYWKRQSLGSEKVFFFLLFLFGPMLCTNKAHKILWHTTTHFLRTSN